jgi:hypothetical protein
MAFFALAAFTALSVAWSAEPSDSWIEASRTLSYAATFAGAIALVRLAPGRWRSVIAGVALATVVVSAYAVMTKIIPEVLATGPTFARLNAPFNYWNAVGLTAALGVPPCLWFGARRDGHGALVGLAAPAICLLLVTLLLCYSRGALIALVVGLAFWFSVTPLRLRAALVLGIGALGTFAVIAWTFAQPALTTDDAALAARTTAGHELGAILASRRSARQRRLGRVIASGSRWSSLSRSFRSPGRSPWRRARAVSPARSRTTGARSPTRTRTWATAQTA